MVVVEAIQEEDLFDAVDAGDVTAAPVQMVNAADQGLRIFRGCIRVEILGGQDALLRDVEVLLTGAGRQDKRSDRKGCIYSFHDCTVLEGNIDTKDQFLGNRVRTVVDAQTGGGGAGMAGLRIEARILREREPVIQGNIGAEGAHRNLLDDPARQGVTQLDLLDLEEGGVIDTQVGATVELVAGCTPAGSA